MAKLLNQTLLESKTLEGDSPVEEIDMLYLKEQGVLDWASEYRWINTEP